jgi:hypothetical protein
MAALGGLVTRAALGRGAGLDALASATSRRGRGGGGGGVTGEGVSVTGEDTIGLQRPGGKRNGAG